MAGKGKPPTIPPADIPKIIDDILSGRKKKSEVAREYGVKQPSIDGLLKRYKEKTGLNEEQLKVLPSLIENTINGLMEFETQMLQYQKTYGEKLVSYHISNARVMQRLHMFGYSENIQLLKNKINAVLQKDTITEKMSIGDGIQTFQERSIDLQDAKHFKDIASTLSSLSYTEGINTKDNSTTVAIQNNNNTNIQTNDTHTQENSILSEYANKYIQEKEKLTPKVVKSTEA